MGIGLKPQNLQNRRCLRMSADVEAGLGEVVGGDHDGADYLL